MLHTSLVKVKANDRIDLLYALRDIGNCDCDFNGENGLDYAWEETLENGFVSNVDWLIDKVKNIENDIECVMEFFATWMNRDSGYYKEYNVEYILNNNGKIIAICFAAITDC